MMSRASPIAIGVSLAALLLAGCGTLEPKYNRPALPTPDAFLHADAGGDAATPVADLEWRSFFTDPKLQQIIALGLENNRDLRVAIANIEATRAQYRIQRAVLLPTVSGTLSAAYGREQLNQPGIGTIAFDEHQYTASVGVNGYELDLFGKVRSLSKAALEQYLSTAEARRAAQISIISQLATDYLTLGADKALLTTAQNTLASSQASLDLAQERFHAGVASELDVNQAQSLVGQSRADVAAATSTVDQDKNALDLIAGASVPDSLLPDGISDPPPMQTDLPAGLPSQVLLARPDVLEAEHQLRSNNAKIGAARAAFFPSITLTGSGGVTSPALSSLFSGSSGIWSFAPQVNIPIFAGGAQHANLDYARAEQKVAVAQYEKAIQSAFRDVANALARRATVDDQVAADEAQVRAAASALRLSQARYERGSDTYLNVLIAQRTLYAAQQALISVRLVKATNLVSLYAALGGGGLVANPRS